MANFLVQRLPRFIGNGILVLTLLSCVQNTHAEVCTQKEAEAADAMIDHLDNWHKIDMAFRKYAQCDDGEIAEGYSEAIARLLVDHWDTLSQLGALVKRDPLLKAFVIRHIDSTLDTNDLDTIRRLSTSSCPSGMASMCKALADSAARSAS